MGTTPSSAASEAAAETRSLHAWHVCAAFALTAGVIALHTALLGRDMLATLRGARALSPLYASWDPHLRPEALVFVLLAGTTLVLAPRLCDPARTGRGLFTLALVVAALALPFALFLVRDGAESFGWPFVFYQHEEFFEDARVATNVMEPGGAHGLLVFLRHYVELMPGLSLHGQHFPPEHALTLAAVNTFTGGGVPTTAAVVLAFCAAGVFAVFAALRELAGERASRQGALLCLAAPALLDFACTSMDAVFFAWAALAWCLALRALRPDARVRSAVGAGVAFAAALFASFAALPVGLAITLHTLLLARSRGIPRTFAAQQLGALAGTTALVFVLVWLTTGFSIVECFTHARASNVAFMTRNLGATPSARWLEVSTGNLGAFLAGAGLALGGSCIALARTGAWAPHARAWTFAALATLAVMTFGNLFTLETERIWLFALPWLAALAVARGAWSDGALRIFLALAFVQAFALETLLFTLW